MNSADKADPAVALAQAHDAVEAASRALTAPLAATVVDPRVRAERRAAAYAARSVAWTRLGGALPLDTHAHLCRAVSMAAISDAESAEQWRRKAEGRCSR